MQKFKVVFDVESREPARRHRRTKLGVRELHSPELVALQAVLGQVQAFDRRHQDLFQRAEALVFVCKLLEQFTTAPDVPHVWAKPLVDRAVIERELLMQPLMVVRARHRVVEELGHRLVHGHAVLAVDASEHWHQDVVQPVQHDRAFVLQELDVE